MTEGPFFSIILPTRNRPSLLESAIQSVLLQGFKDVELIISDNSTNDVSQKIISNYSGDHRVQSFKPEQELNMLEHWEYASKKARGKYIFILTDRNVFINNALQLIHDNIIKHETVNCFVVGIQSFNENSGTLKKKTHTRKSKTFLSKDLLSNFSETIWSNSSKSKCLDYCYPKSLNSFILNKYIKEFRELNGSYYNFNQVKTPDYSSFFINCHLLKEVRFLGMTLLLRQGNEDSNGGKVNKGDTSYLNSLHSQQLNGFDYMVDIPLVYNFIYSDFAIISRHFKSIPTQNQQMILNYYENLFYELEMKDKSFYKSEDIESMKQLIIEKMKTIGFKDLQIETALINVKEKYSHFNKLYDSFYQNWDIHFKDFLHSRFEKTSIINKMMKFHYPSILEAAGFNKDLFI